MADSSGQADIRGIDIDKLAKGFADEALLMKRFCTQSKTKAREVRWYQKTAGFLDSTDTTGITTSQIKLQSTKSRPVVVEQSWTRNTSYVKKYFVESPLISMEDIKDADIDILAGNVRDLVRAVGYQVDVTIYDAITEGANIGTGAATADGWDDAATGDPIKDILTAKQAIRAQGYNPEGAVLLINSIEHRNLMTFLINVKGSSIPSFASEKVKSGVVMNLLGLQVVVSEIATTDEALIFIPQRACTWKQFAPITSVVMDEPGIGKKIRVWEEGIPLLTDPKAVYLITDTVT
jgi:hypothetical protein|tara:strand:+ start:6753 stop:7628 length:876 start_codon:yes stop_codon:yes gene_type:complete